jgi:hypothetical protein
MSVEKISTVLRKACEWSAEHPDARLNIAIYAGACDATLNAAIDYVCDLFPEVDYFTMDDDETARSILLGLAAAIAESEGL